MCSTATITSWEHATLELWILYFTQMTYWLPPAVTSLLGVECKQQVVIYGWLKKEDAYRTVGHFYVRIPCSYSLHHFGILVPVLFWKFVGAFGVGLVIIAYAYGTATQARSLGVCRTLIRMRSWWNSERLSRKCVPQKFSRRDTSSNHKILDHNVIWNRFQYYDNVPRTNISGFLVSYCWLLRHRGGHRRCELRISLLCCSLVPRTSRPSVCRSQY